MKNSNTDNALSMTINALAGAGLILLTTALPASADENVTLHDTTIGELSAGWWQWQEANYSDFSFGEGLVDCSLGQSGPVWYLGGTGGGVAERTCNAPIKGHKHLMFPLVNGNFFNPDTACDFVDPSGDPENPTVYCTVEEKRELLDGLFSEDPAGIFNSTACLLQAEVDGVPAVYSSPIVRTQTPPHQYDADFEAVADGFWVVLSPLPRGEHTIHFTGGICSLVDDLGDPEISEDDILKGDVLFGVDVTYNLTIK